MHEPVTAQAPSSDRAIWPPPRTAGYLGQQTPDAFAIYHPPLGPQKACTVVICNPLGHEAIRCHRALRCLAEQLAEAGYPTLRFDYQGTGDSTGADDDPNRVDAWLASLDTALRTMEGVSEPGRVCVVGVRMGATLAALAAAHRTISYLVLWEPCVRGATYTREMAMVASASLKGLLGGTVGRPGSGSGIEAAGFRITPETQAHLDGIDLRASRPAGQPEILVIARDDRPEDRTLVSYYTDIGLRCEYRRLPGHPQMMAAPAEALVPHAIHDAISDWLNARTAPPAQNGAGAPALSSHLTLSVPGPTPGESVEIVETPITFGPDQRLFGIKAVPAGGSDPHLPAVILLPGGSVPRSSATRMYVPLARRLSAQGMTTLRMDVSGIGDSLAAEGAPDNDAYTPALLSDVQAAMEALVTHSSSGPQSIHLLGLCSGAYASFATALDTPSVVGITLINPLVFHLDGNVSLETPSVQRFLDAAYYRKAVFSLATWKRILRGRVNIGRAVSTILGRVLARIQSTLGPSRPPTDEGPLGSELRGLADRGVAMHMAFSHGDPGHQSLMETAGGAVMALQKENRLSLRVFERTDHIFSPFEARDALIEWITEAIGH